MTELEGFFDGIHHEGGTVVTWSSISHQVWNLEGSKHSPDIQEEDKFNNRFDPWYRNMPEHLEFIRTIDLCSLVVIFGNRHDPRDEKDDMLSTVPPQ